MVRDEAVLIRSQAAHDVAPQGRAVARVVDGVGLVISKSAEATTTVG